MMTPPSAARRKDANPEADWQVVDRISASSAAAPTPDSALKPPAEDYVTSKKKVSPLSIGSKAKRDSHKRQGDAAFRSAEYDKALDEYTSALHVDPTNFILLSNRSAAYLKVGNSHKALSDAQLCIQIEPSNARGHSRLGAALYSLQQWEDAAKAYEKVLELDPTNQVAKRELETCRKQAMEQQKANNVQATEASTKGPSKSLTLEQMQERQVEQLVEKTKTTPEQKAPYSLSDGTPQTASAETAQSSPATKPLESPNVSTTKPAAEAVASPVLAPTPPSPVAHTSQADSASAVASPGGPVATRVPTSFIQSQKSPPASPLKAALPCGKQSPMRTPLPANVSQQSPAVSSSERTSAPTSNPSIQQSPDTNAKPATSPSAQIQHASIGQPQADSQEGTQQNSVAGSVAAKSLVATATADALSTATCTESPAETKRAASPSSATPSMSQTTAPGPATKHLQSLGDHFAAAASPVAARVAPEPPAATQSCASDNSTSAPDAISQHVQPANVSTQVPSFASAQSMFASPARPKQPPHPSSRSNTGLSELSKQLRVLQATNESQVNQIDRLERQLKIMSDLKGVSVHDLRSALLAACEEEAHADLQNQIAYLKSRLEAAELSKGKKDAASFEKEAADKKVANLELKLAENEEFEESLRSEIRGLYQKLSQEQSKSATLHSTCEQQKQQLDEMLRKSSLVKVETQQCQWALPAVEPPPEEEENRIVVQAEALRSAELQAKLEKDRANLLETQAQAREKEAQLRNEQYKSRFQVQDERIFDLEQQLSSLYTAFELLRQEHAGDQEKREALNTNLANADSQVAMQLHTKMKSERSLGDTPTVQGTPIAASAQATPMSASSSDIYAKPMPPSMSPRASPQKLYRDKSRVAVTTPSAIESQHVASGYLLKRDKQLLRGGWKKRYFVLHGSNPTYHLSYSEGPNEKFKGTIGFITTNISTVDQSCEFPKHPFVFVLRINPNDVKAPILHASAPNEQEYQRWLSALTLVTTGHDSTVATRTPQEQEAADHEVALRMQMEYMR